MAFQNPKTLRLAAYVSALSTTEALKGLMRYYRVN